jgi:ribonuclease P protein component
MCSKAGGQKAEKRYPSNRMLTSLVRARKTDFDSIFRFGKPFSSGFLLLKVLTSLQGEASIMKFAVAVSSKYSKKSVERNRIKRWLREGIMAYKKDIIKSGGMIIIANENLKKHDNINYGLFKDNIGTLLKKAGII